MSGRYVQSLNRNTGLLLAGRRDLFEMREKWGIMFRLWKSQGNCYVRQKKMDGRFGRHRPLTVFRAGGLFFIHNLKQY